MVRMQPEITYCKNSDMHFLRHVHKRVMNRYFEVSLCMFTI
jgi:hypothetical protein